MSGTHDHAGTPKRTRGRLPPGKGMFGFGSKKQDWQAKVTPSGKLITVKAGENLLRAALDAGLGWPHDCRVGSCGTCRCRLVEGKIKELSDFSYVLEGDDLDRGMILACQTALKSDIVVEVQLDSAVPAGAISTVQGVLARTRALTHDVLELTVKLEKPFPHSGEARSQSPYVAGQYAEIAFPSIEKPRAYSFARAPENEAENELTFFVRKVPNGELTTWLFEKDRVGTPVTVTGPFGSFWLREGDGPVVCIAGGSGMSSIRALLEHASNKGVTRDVVYLFGARTQKDLYCLEDMEAITRKWNSGRGFRFVPVLSEEPADSDWQGLRGMVTEHIGQQGVDLAQAQAYLCGPPPMIDAAIEVLKKSGVQSANIHFDKFLDASSMPGGRK